MNSAFRKVGLLAAAVALFVALGIVLGSGPLQHDRESSPSGADGAADSSAAGNQAAESFKAFADGYGRATAGQLLAGRLKGRAVGILTLPGVAPGAVADLTGTLRVAGATVTVQAEIPRSVASGRAESLADALTRQVAEQSPALGLDPAAPAIERLGAMLARGLAVPGSATAGGAYDPPAVNAVTSLEAAKLIGEVEIERRASATIVLGPAGADRPLEPSSISDLLRGYAGRTPTLLATPATVGGPGLVDQVLAAEGVKGVVAGVDGTDSALGRITAVLALVERVQGRAGRYGPGAGDPGAIPSG